MLTGARGRVSLVRVRTVVGTLTLGLVAGLAACGGAARAPAPRPPLRGCTVERSRLAVTVDATQRLTFVPAAVCLRRGGTVTFVNVTRHFDHTTTDEAALAAAPADAQVPPGGHGWSHVLPPGARARIHLSVDGTYRYFCIPHERLGMVGTIRVVG
ncbi:MAG TPA: plastocyanin/azurin family copper-binding protein [Candidatus Micrarchaeia archaeon]|nr:plastocyanin/azurin family copper-binding protein [Candidatus Micrarchaeia archaeon]